MSDYNKRMAIYMTARYHRRRAEWIAKLGGFCVVCKSEDNLNFDHINANEKSYDVGKILSSGSEVKVFTEMAKCQLLCHDCHVTKSQAMRDVKFVEHGEGITGKKNCYCDLCAPLKREYDKQYKRDPVKRGRILKTEPQHGERRTYTGKTKCRCDLCKEAQRLYMVEYKSK